MIPEQSPPGRDAGNISPGITRAAASLRAGMDAWGRSRWQPARCKDSTLQADIAMQQI